MHERFRGFALLLAMSVLLSFMLPTDNDLDRYRTIRLASAQQPADTGPPLSQAGRMSRFAKENKPEEAIDIAQITAVALQRELQSIPTDAALVSTLFNFRPQNEPSIAIRPGTGGATAAWVIGANDFGLNFPVAGGIYSSGGVRYFTPFPALFAKGGSGSKDLTEAPSLLGDPALAYGLTRPAPGVPPFLVGAPIAYYALVAASSTFCEIGITVQRSFNNGFFWNTAVVPAFFSPRGFGIAAYWDKAQNCSVFHDKPYITVDNTGGPHDGRVYVTWTRFDFGGQQQFKAAVITMVWSDDNAATFSDPVVVSGFSPTLCPSNAIGSGGACDRSQFSVPAVLPDGKVAIAFIAGGSGPVASARRGKYLVTIFDPDTGRLEGPYKVADLFDGPDDYPVSLEGARTLCNSDFRVNAAGNIAVGKDGALYLAYSDDRKRAGSFPRPTSVGNTASGYACPPGKSTDTDVYVLKSTDRGRTWTDISPSSTKAANDQWFPWVAADATGRVSVVFYDRSGDPGNKLAHTSLAQSSDGGATWKTTTVSDFASNFDTAFFGLGNFIGDYLGNAIDSAGASHPVWTGLVPGAFDSDIFKATVLP